jgi:hypothetical protein
MSTEYPSFRKMFWEESANNPRLATAKLDAYGVDAHFIDTNNDWRSKGSKFSQEKRKCQIRLMDDAVFHGPEHAEEYKYLSEKPVQYFGRVRRIRPLARIKTAPREVVASNTMEFRLSSSWAMLPKDEWAPHQVYGTIRSALH